jgi:hydroxyacyl-ACP dehydratase HTD2-like protein with hotdog domain
MLRGWNALPPEMNLSVLDLLSLDDLKAFSISSRLCRQLAMSTLFKVRAFDHNLGYTNSIFSSQSVKLDGYEAVESFLSRFPSGCRIYVRTLYVSMRPNEVMQQYDCTSSQTDLLVILLSTCTTIQSLTLYVFGSPHKHIVPPFAGLIHLTSLSIGNVASEQLMPL